MEKFKKALYAVIGILGALFLYERSKRKSLEAVVENNEVLDKVNKIDGGIEKNNARLEVEEEKRETIKKELENEKDKNNSPNELVDFFNNRK